MNNREHNVAALKELMTALPMTAEIHAARMRQRTEARRFVEDAMESARQKREQFEPQPK